MHQQVRRFAYTEQRQVFQKGRSGHGMKHAGKITRIQVQHFTDLPERNVGILVILFDIIDRGGEIRLCLYQFLLVDMPLVDDFRHNFKKEGIDEEGVLLVRLAVDERNEVLLKLRIFIGERWRIDGKSRFVIKAVAAVPLKLM